MKIESTSSGLKPLCLKAEKFGHSTGWKAIYCGLERCNRTVKAVITIESFSLIPWKGANLA